MEEESRRRRKKRERILNRVGKVLQNGKGGVGEGRVVTREEEDFSKSNRIQMKKVESKKVCVSLYIFL